MPTFADSCEILLAIRAGKLEARRQKRRELAFDTARLPAAPASQPPVDAVTGSDLMAFLLLHPLGQGDRIPGEPECFRLEFAGFNVIPVETPFLENRSQRTGSRRDEPQCESARPSAGSDVVATQIGEIPQTGMGQQAWSSRTPGIVIPQTIPGKVLVERRVQSVQPDCFTLGLIRETEEGNLAGRQ